MDITKLFGLPAHPLLVHAPIVLLPLVALGAVVLVFVPPWRSRFGWLLVGAAGAALVSVQLALMSGEGLEEHVEESRVLERHTDMAPTLRPLAIGLFLVILALVWLESRRRSDRPVPSALTRPVATYVLGALIVVLSLASTVRLVQIGHNGAKASWHDVDLSREREGGDRDEDGD